jgi:hypothetical protein
MQAAPTPARHGPSPVRQYSHYEVAYIKLRTSMAVLSLLLPVSLFVVSYVLRNYGLQPSISHYYIAGDFERNLLVAMLSCIGVFLIMYEGYSSRENRVLDAAGLLLIVVAFVPLDLESFPLWGWDVPVAWKLGEIMVSVHGLCAVGFFFCMIYVSTVLSGETLVGREDSVRCKWLTRYWLVSAVMGATMLATLVGHQIPGTLFHERAVFWIESVGVVAFAVFWLMKTREVNPTVAYRLRAFSPLANAAVETLQPNARLNHLCESEATGADAAPAQPGAAPHRPAGGGSSICSLLQWVQRKLGAGSTADAAATAG